MSGAPRESGVGAAAANGKGVKRPRSEDAGCPSKAIETLAIHGGDQHDPGHGAIFPPITTATTFVQPNLGEHGSFCYSRCSNPTRNAYETALAALEGGPGAYCTATASGMAATALALELLEPGGHVLLMSGLYGGTQRLFEQVKTRSMGLEFTSVDFRDLGAVARGLRENTRMVWLESPSNPLVELVDIPAVVQCVRKASTGTAPIVCADNTFASAWNQRPLELGVDLVMLSASKYVGGHSDMTGGALITRDPKIAERLNFLKSSIGAIASPFEAYLALRGLKTLAIRMERQCANALRVAEYLEGHPRIVSLHYPGLPSSPHYDLCRRQMRTGGAVVTIRLRSCPAGNDTCMLKRFFARLRYWVLAESLGGVESMINHSASMSHGSMTEEARQQAGVFFTTLRLSVGIELAEDLIGDLEQALAE